jgi:hypothetical protein
MVTKLLEWGFDVNGLGYYSYYHHQNVSFSDPATPSPLMAAIQNDQHAVVRLLLFD